MPSDPSLIYTLLQLNKRIKQLIERQIPGDHKAIPFELLSHISPEGRTLTQLTELMQCSKQETSRQVKRALEYGWIELKPDPEDGRAKRVCFSMSGVELLQQGRKLYQQLEAEWAVRLGDEQVQTLRQLLQSLDSVIGTAD